jgi:hypothetical protein
VSFRLSQEEYEALMNTSIAQGARSISGFARAAACSFSALRDGLPEQAVETTIRSLHRKVEQLDREVRRLAHLVELSQAQTVRRRAAGADASGSIPHEAERKGA